MSVISRFFKPPSPPPAAAEQSFALDQLDLKLKPYLNYRRGIFVEAGANDGQTYSNTLYFEKYRGWRGLLIEPIPELAEQCRRNRPHCRVENCALVPFNYSAPKVAMHYCNMMSLVKGAMKSAEADQRHIQLGCQVQRISSYELTVPARTLTSVLRQHRLFAIDLLSLDVEGFELQVLQGLDFEHFAPKFMLIEARFREEIDTFLQPRYEPVATLSNRGDVLYRRRSLLRRAPAVAAGGEMPFQSSSSGRQSAPSVQGDDQSRLTSAATVQGSDDRTRKQLALRATAENTSPLRVILGTGATPQPDWLPTDIDTLNIVQTKDWETVFGSARIDLLLAEHVWEHLSAAEAQQANANCFRFLKPGGRLRLAVPDALHPDPNYWEQVRPGGSGPGAQDHKQFYDYKLLSAALEAAGFEVRLLEYWDETGQFHFTGWSSTEGHIRRSKRYDPRNQDGSLTYTSLIADAIKPMS